jgi:ClpP class serine protease
MDDVAGEFSEAQRQLAAEIKKSTEKKKKVVVSIESVGASGAYYVASAVSP